MDEISTSDLYYAAYLHALGMEILRTDVSSSQSVNQGFRHHFVFADPKGDINTLKTGWFTGRGMVSAQVYSASIKLLKQLVHA